MRKLFNAIDKISYVTTLDSSYVGFSSPRPRWSKPPVYTILATLPTRFCRSELTTVTMLAKTAYHKSMSVRVPVKLVSIISDLGEIMEVLQQEQRHDSEYRRDDR